MNRRVSTTLVATLPLLYATFTRHFSLSLPLGFYACARLLALEKVHKLERFDWPVLSRKSRTGALLATLVFPFSHWLCVPLALLPLKLNLECLEPHAPFLLLHACSSPLDLLVLVCAVQYESDDSERHRVRKLALEFLQDAAFVFTLAMHGMRWAETTCVFLLTFLSATLAWRDRMPLYQMAKGVAEGIYKQA